MDKLDTAIQALEFYTKNHDGGGRARRALSLIRPDRQARDRARAIESYASRLVQEGFHPLDACQVAMAAMKGVEV